MCAHTGVELLQYLQSKIRGDLLGADKFIQGVLQRYPKSSVTIQLVAHDGQGHQP